MPAVVSGHIFTGSGPTEASAEAGVAFGRDDNPVSTAVLPIPNVQGTKFSWPKTFALAVTGGTATNHINNRRAVLSASLPTGMHMWWKNATVYAQAAAPAAVDSTLDYAVPSGYSGGSELGGEVTATEALWDNTSAITSVGQNGNFVRTAVGVDSQFAGGGGSDAVGSMFLEYDEGP